MEAPKKVVPSLRYEHLNISQFFSETLYVYVPVVARQLPCGAQSEVVPGPLEGPRLALHHTGQQHLTVNISDKWKYFIIGTDNISG